MGKYKIIVFDMDGTLYDLKDVISMNYQIQCDFLASKEKMTKMEAGSLLESNCIYPEIRRNSKSCTEFFEQRGYDKVEWNGFREEHFDESFISKKNSIENSVLDKFAKHFILLLLTSNSQKNVHRILNHLDIDAANFKEIICSDSTKINTNFNKKTAFEYIIDKYNVESTEILSVGDRFETDIHPLLMMGGSGVLIKKPEFLAQLHDDLMHKDLNSCQYYEFFEKKRILILGGAGTIGLPISRRLSETSDYDVTILCRKKREIKNVHIIIGDFSDSETQNKILCKKWDCIIDLLWHNEKRFHNTYEKLASCTNHYISFSTAAVYADNVNPIKEDSLRFWDETKSNEDYYHLQKARMENIIFDSPNVQWTIVRPHVTFNVNRIPLITWEQEIWLYRFMQGKSIILTNKMLGKMTSFTYGENVARLIEAIVASGTDSFGEIYNVCSDDKLKWGEVVDLISMSLKKITGQQIKLKILDEKSEYGKLEKMLPHKADRLKYDRYLDRVLDNTKVKKLDENCNFSILSEDIYNCLNKRIAEFNERIQYSDVFSIAYMDYVCKEHTALKDIEGRKNKLKYLFLRYFINYRFALHMWMSMKKIRDKLQVIVRMNKNL